MQDQQRQQPRAPQVADERVGAARPARGGVGPRGGAGRLDRGTRFVDRGGLGGSLRRLAGGHSPDHVRPRGRQPPLDKPARTRLNGPRVRAPRRDPRRDAKAIGRAARSRALAPEEEIWSLLSAIGNAGVVDLLGRGSNAKGGAAEAASPTPRRRCGRVRRRQGRRRRRLRRRQGRGRVRGRQGRHRRGRLRRRQGRRQRGRLRRRQGRGRRGRLRGRQGRRGRLRPTARPAAAPPRAARRGRIRRRQGRHRRLRRRQGRRERLRRRQGRRRRRTQAAKASRRGRLRRRQGRRERGAARRQGRSRLGDAKGGTDAATDSGFEIDWLYDLKTRKPRP